MPPHYAIVYIDDFVGMLEICYSIIFCPWLYNSFAVLQTLHSFTACASLQRSLHQRIFPQSEFWGLFVDLEVIERLHASQKLKTFCEFFSQRCRTTS